MKTRPIPSLSVMFSDLVSSPLWECKMITWWRNASPKEIEEDVGIGKLAGTYFSDTALAWNKMKDSEDEDRAAPRPIETAPQSGKFLAFFINSWSIVQRGRQAHRFFDECLNEIFPTHWLPFPAPPAGIKINSFLTNSKPLIT